MSDGWFNRCHFGDVRAVLRQMIEDGVQVNTIVTSPPYWGLRSYLPEVHADKALEIGLEPTLPEFIAALVDVFDLCRQVLHDDGTAWVNMGDSYANDGKWGGASGGKHPKALHGNTGIGRRKVSTGLKPKDLIGQPWRLAFALQDAGWYLRQDIIWHKPNPMPESTRDRCTKSHEYIFLLSKSQQYWFDQEAILEPVSENTHAGLSQNVAAQVGSTRAHAGGKTNGNMKAVGRKLADAGSGTKNNTSMDEALAVMPTKRNRRSVWTVASEPYSGAHFATFPTKLIEPCILAGAPAGGVVLDPFFGSGTTGQVAQALGRQWIGIELNPAYKALQDARLAQMGLTLEVA